MKKEIIAIVFATLMIVSAFAMLVAISPSPVNNGNPVGVPDTTTQPYATIILTNSQSTATPVNFQQLIKVDWSKYTSDLNSNVSNVRFYNSTTFTSAYELYGWMETNNTTTATSSNVWLNLSNTIVPADGSVNIYMIFLSKTSSWSSHWGLAPELSTKYAQFDNGAHVFNYYWNFAGTSLPTGWVGSGYAVDNGIYTNTSGDYANYSFSTPKVAPFVLDYCGYNDGSTSYSEIGMDNPPTRTDQITFQFESVSNGAAFMASNAVNTASVLVPSVSTFTVYTVQYVSTSLVSGQISYGKDYNLTTYIPTKIPAVGMYNHNGNTMFVQWMRTRLYAPDGVMPTASVSLLGYPVTFISNFPNSAEWNISIGTTSRTVTTNTTQFSFTNGTYEYNATLVDYNPLSGKFTVAGNSLTIYLNFTPLPVATFVSSFLYGHTWNVSVGKTNHIQTTNSTKFTLSNGTYTYNASVSQPSSADMYHIKNLTGTFKIDGSNLTIHLNFGIPVHSFAIPIKLYNNQTTSVVENTPILIHVDWEKYFPYIFGNISNVRFYTNNEHYYTIYELPAWLQSGNSALDTNSSVWINLEADSIAAHSSTIIYMYIDGSNTWSKYWGESPLLSSTYAKHDNGANVFQVYWNFAGTSMSGWNKDGSGTGASSSMDNGLQQSVIDSSLTQTVAVNTTAFTKSYIFDVNLSYTGASYSNDTYLAILTGPNVGYYASEPFGFTSSGMAIYWTPDISASSSSEAYFGDLTSDGGLGTVGLSSVSNDVGHEAGVYWTSTQYLFKNYIETASTTVGGTPPSTYYLGFSMSNNQYSTSTANQTVHYLDGRIAPPNNTLPAYQIEPANVSTIQFNETGLPSGQAWSVNVSGVITTSTSSTITVFADAGTYNYTTNTSNDVDFKILPKSGSVNVSAFTDYYVNIDYINISYPVVFYQNTLISGVSWSVWLNNTTVQKELSSTGNTVTFYSTNGTYTYYVMTPVFDAVTFTVSPQTAGLGVDGPSFTYLTNITFTYSAYEVVFSQNGLIYPQSWSLVINSTTYKSNPSEQVIFWGNAHKSYSASINSPTLQIHPEQKTYNFTLNASLSYTVDFVIDVTIVESGYTGEWHAIVNTAEYSSTTNTIVAEVVPGYITISIWITDTGYTITPAQTVYSNALTPFTLNVTFSQTPTNYVTAIFGNLTFIYVVVFIGILIFAVALVMKLRRR